MTADPTDSTAEKAPPPELVTLAVIAYRQESVVRAAIEGAFAQTYPNLEIILSDDASPDGTFAVMQDMAAAYDGPHKIVLNRNTPNLGLIGHVNRIFDMARGCLIVANAGDDISLPERCTELYHAFRQTRPLLVDSELIPMAQDGQVLRRSVSRRDVLDGLDQIDKLATSMRSVVGASCGWNPDLHRIFGPITEAAAYEDQVIYFRARLAGRVAHVPKPLVKYRQGGMSRGDGGPAWKLKKTEVALATMRQRLADLATFEARARGLISAEETSLTAMRDRLTRRIARGQAE